MNLEEKDLCFTQKIDRGYKLKENYLSKNCR